MNITTNYQLNSLNLRTRANKQSLHTNPAFCGNKQQVQGAIGALAGLATIGESLVLAAKSKDVTAPQEIPTLYGPVTYIQRPDGKKSSLVVSRPNGMIMDIFKGIPQEVLESPVTEHLHQVNASTINPNVGIVLVQNQSNPVTARKVVVEGTLENSLVKNNITNIPTKYSSEQDSMYTDTPWFPGIQYANQKCFQVTYGTVKEDWGARPEYIAEYADPKTGEAPDVAILAAQKGTEDRSFMPADIAGKQYEVVTESGERIPCNYEEMKSGVDYKISKKAGVELKMAVPPTNVTSSEGEDLEAGKLYMVDSNGHFYNGNPVKRIKSGEVTWNADLTDPAQLQIKEDIDESLRLEADSKAAKKEAAVFDKQANALREKAAKRNAKNLKEIHKHNVYAAKLNKQANELSAKAGELKTRANNLNSLAKKYTAKAELEMTEWVKSAQNPEGIDFFAENA